ncbi:hypothetical protein [Rubritalea sp.]|uniref:hypothetical protein n=1 Tax=Rubritalea sp. TaxID=2109375 RepID=UPI003EF9ACAC
MKKRYIIPTIIFAVLCVAYWDTEGVIKPIPKSPALATDLGRYSIDDYRSIQVQEINGKIQYSEITADKNVKTHGIEKHINIKLSRGWSITSSDPDSIQIQTGTGITINRKFGQPDLSNEPNVESTVEHN